MLTKRRTFLRAGFGAAAGMGMLGACAAPPVTNPASPSSPSPSPSPSTVPDQHAVAIVRAEQYEDSYDALKRSFDLLDSIGQLVSGKTVTVKVNLTGYATPVLGRAPELMYATHGSTVAALATLLHESGAKRVRIVESIPGPQTLQAYGVEFGWDIAAIFATGNVEMENTRNLGAGRAYAVLPARTAMMFDHFELNHSYADTDVFVSLAKMKNHRAAGVTLALKNLFGIMPSSRYGVDAPSEDATGFRTVVHERLPGTGALFPGELLTYATAGADVRVPRTIVDLLAARPIDLAIIDGISTMAGGEGPWSASSGELSPRDPHVMIVGRDAVATDAVAVNVMGYRDALATGQPPFHFSENHILLAHQAGLGVGDLSRIDVRGVSIADARTAFAWTE